MYQIGEHFSYDQSNIKKSRGATNDNVSQLINHGLPNFLDRGPFSEIWTKARATPHNSICFIIL